MNKLALTLIALVFFSGCSTATHEQPVSHLEQKFLETNFTAKTHTRLVERQVMDLLGSMADPGEAYNQSDAVNLKLPMTELIFAGQAPNMAFVFYNQGGIALTKNLLIVELNDNQKVVHACTYHLKSVGRYKDLENLKRDFPTEFYKDGCL